MFGLETAENFKKVNNPKEEINSGVLLSVDNLESLSDIGLKEMEIELQNRRKALQAEIESVNEDLKGINEEKFKRNETGK